MTSPAFALEPLGPPAPCGFPRCVLEAFHDGDHHLAPIERPVHQPIYTCRECGTRFVIYGKVLDIERRTCGKQKCLLAAARREAANQSLPLNCRCSQRLYAHELTVHTFVRFESRAMRWPWSLRAAPEMSR